MQAHKNNINTDMDTRMKLMLLVDYSEYYGDEKTIEYAKELIAKIPSSTLINYISGFNIHLYLNEQEGIVQNYLIHSLLEKMSKKDRNDWQKRTIDIRNCNNINPIYIWSYSNYLFYEVIFSIYNDLPCRDLTSKEARSFFDAYLIVNGIANSLIDPTKSDFEIAKENGNTEHLIISNFIHQRDFTSNLDFRNQIIRGVSFFKYLEGHSEYGNIIGDYYKLKGTVGYLDFFKTILLLIMKTHFTDKPNKRKQIVLIDKDDIEFGINIHMIDSLCINDSLVGDKFDLKLLWTKPLLKISEYQYYVLDINLLINQLYKSEVFEFGTFLKSIGNKTNFLSVKGKEFSEEIYFTNLINNSFPHLLKFFGSSCKNSKNEELCDVYLRDKNKVILFEFKDNLFNDSVKQKRDVEQTIKELDKKFFQNQYDSPKGISQLANAINDIFENGICFDRDSPEKVEIYPIVVYTDNALGMDGINLLYRDLFKELLNKPNHNIVVEDVAFINLSYFEMHEELFEAHSIDIFTLLKEYNKHTEITEYKLAPFEVFSRFYLRKTNAPDMPNSKRFQETIKIITEHKSERYGY